MTTVGPLVSKFIFDMNNAEVDEIVAGIGKINAALASDTATNAFSRNASERLTIERKFMTNDELRIQNLHELYAGQEKLNLSQRAFFGSIAQIEIAHSAKAFEESGGKAEAAANAAAAREKEANEAATRKLADAQAAAAIAATNAAEAYEREINVVEKLAEEQRLATTAAREAAAQQAINNRLEEQAMTTSQRYAQQMHALRGRQADLSPQAYTFERDRIANEARQRQEADARRQREADIRAAGTVQLGPTRADYTAQVANERRLNAERQAALSIVRSVQTEEQRLIQIRNELAAASARGSITQAEYNTALEGLAHRQQAMAGGAGRMRYALGSLTTGLEDFVVVSAQSGFSMNSFGAAMRASSNNISQFVSAFNPLMAGFAGIAAVLVGMAIPAIYKWITGVEEEIKIVNNAIERLKELQKVKQDIAAAELHTSKIGGQFDETDLKGNEAKLRAEEEKLVIAKQAVLDQEALVATARQVRIETGFGKVGSAGLAEMQANLSVRGKTAIDEGIKTNDEDLIAVGVRYTNAADNLATITQGMQQALADGNESLVMEYTRQFQTWNENNNRLVRTIMDENPNQGIFEGEFGGFTPVTDFQEGELVDQFQKFSKDEEGRVKREDDVHAEGMATEESLRNQQTILNDIVKLKAEIAEQEAITQETLENANRIRDNAFEDEKIALRQQSQRNQMIGEEFEAERELFDLAKRRDELQRSGLGSDAELEGMFDAELEARAKDLEKQMDKEDFIPGQADAASVTKSVTDANKMMVAAINKPEDVKHKEMKELLTAIRDHLAGRRKIDMEIVQ